MNKLCNTCGKELEGDFGIRSCVRCYNSLLDKLEYYAEVSDYIQYLYKLARDMKILDFERIKYEKEEPKRIEKRQEKMIEKELQFIKNIQNPNDKRIGSNAGQKLNYEIKMGRIVRQPCVVCGKQNAEGHHMDYSYPLDVLWLCPSHHKKHHFNMEKAKQKV